MNASLAFGEDHENHQESIFKLLEQLFRGSLRPEELEPLHVFVKKSPQGNLGLYSRSNRRLVALLMFQAVRRDELVHTFSREHLWVRCGGAGDEGRQSKGLVP